MSESSRLFIHPETAELLLRRVLAGRPELAATLSDDGLRLELDGLVITVHQATLTAAGIDLRLRFDNRPGAPGEVGDQP